MDNQAEDAKQSYKSLHLINASFTQAAGIGMTASMDRGDSRKSAIKSLFQNIP